MGVSLVTATFCPAHAYMCLDVDIEESRFEPCDQIIGSSHYSPWVLRGTNSSDFGSGQAQYQAYNLETKQTGQILPLDLQVGGISPSGRLLVGTRYLPPAAGDVKPTMVMSVMDSQTGKVVKDIPVNELTNSAQFLNDSNLLLETVNKVGAKRLAAVDIANGKRSWDIPKPLAYAVSADGSYLAITDSKNKFAIKIVDAVNGNETMLIQLPGAKKSWLVNQCAFSQDSKRLLVTANGGRAGTRCVVFDLEKKQVFAEFTFASKHTLLSQINYAPLHLTNDGVVVIGHHTAIDPKSGQVIWRATKWIGKNAKPTYVRTMPGNKLIFVYPDEETADKITKIEATSFMQQVVVDLPGIGAKYEDEIKLEPKHLFFEFHVYKHMAVGEAPFSWNKKQNALKNKLSPDIRKAVDQFEARKLTPGEFKTQITAAGKQLLDSLDGDQRLRLWLALSSHTVVPQDLDRAIAMMRPELNFPTIPWKTKFKTTVTVPKTSPKNMNVPLQQANHFFRLGTINIPRETNSPILFVTPQSVAIWSVIDNRVITNVPRDLKDVTKLIVSDDERFAAVYQNTPLSICSIIDLKNTRVVRRFTTNGPGLINNWPWHTLQIKNTTLFYLKDNRLCKWNFSKTAEPNPKDSFELPNRVGGLINSEQRNLALSNDGRYVALHDYHHVPAIFIQETATGKIIGRTPIIDAYRLGVLSFSPDDKLLALVMHSSHANQAGDARVVIIETSSGDILQDVTTPAFLTPGRKQNAEKRQLLWSADCTHCLIGLKHYIDVETGKVDEEIKLPPALDQQVIMNTPVAGQKGPILEHAWLTKNHRLVLLFSAQENNGQWFARTHTIQLKNKK